MKKGLIYGLLGLGALGGGALLLNSSNTTTDTNYAEERSYEEYGDLDCEDFDNQTLAQEFYETEDPDNWHGLDADEDGEACETLE